jgi:outer membrane biosynthesis protein TonB
MNLAIQRTPVERPGLLGKNSIRGEVSVEVLIDEQGKLQCARGIGGHPIAIPAAIWAIRKWTFNPYSVRGRAKSVLGTLIIPFDFGQ